MAYLKHKNTIENVINLLVQVHSKYAGFLSVSVIKYSYSVLSLTSTCPLIITFDFHQRSSIRDAFSCVTGTTDQQCFGEEYKLPLSLMCRSQRYFKRYSLFQQKKGRTNRPMWKRWSFKFTNTQSNWRRSRCINFGTCRQR